MRSYELDQETKITNYKSHQIQWIFMQQSGQFVASTTLILQFSLRSVYQYTTSWWNSLMSTSRMAFVL